MAAEEAQELGRKGVLDIKRWLESTTYINVDWIIYDNQPACTVENLSDKPKRFDLMCRFLGKKKRPLIVECKAYKTVGGQAAGFDDFLATAYSSIARKLDATGDDRAEFMWVTYHPFSQTKWNSLLSKKNIRAALALPRNVALLGGKAIDEDVVDLLAERLWVLVMHRKQKKLTLSQTELSRVFAELERRP